jgi:hypothetical protein
MFARLQHFQMMARMKTRLVTILHLQQSFQTVLAPFSKSVSEQPNTSQVSTIITDFHRAMLAAATDIACGNPRLNGDCLKFILRAIPGS